MSTTEIEETYLDIGLNVGNEGDKDNSRVLTYMVV